VSPLEYSLNRVAAVLEEIGRLKESEFPYPHSRDALIRIEQLFLNHRSKLEALNTPGKNPAIVRSFCSTALTDLFKYLPLLGFILRSTNVRNAFEVYGPLLRLSKLVLGKDIKLILSSEWEEYSPFTFREISELPNFVLIGFPAPESANPLLLPLAGHELGHTIWRVQSLSGKHLQKVEEKIIAEIESRLKEYQDLYPNQNAQKGQLNSNIFVKQTIAVPTQWAIKQCEEHFCDFVGLYVFDQSYLHAFAYLLSPHTAGQRSVLYPNILTRVAKLVDAAAKFRGKVGSGYGVPTNYHTLFENMADVPDKERHKKFLLSLADAASGGLAPDFVDEAQSILSAAKIPLVSSDERNGIREGFKFVVPAAHAQNLSNIVNAAWDVYHDKDFWIDKPQIEDPRRVLREMVLKSIEVLEIEQLLHE
jgi:hypothetical protein